MRLTLNTRLTEALKTPFGPYTDGEALSAKCKSVPSCSLELRNLQLAVRENDPAVRHHTLPIVAGYGFPICTLLVRRA